MQSRFTRAGFVRRVGAVAAGVSAGGSFAGVAGADEPPRPGPRPVTPDAALKRLLKGNERYVRRQVRHPRQGHERRRDLAREQHPFALILGCVDSRVPPEVVFDQGLGDLFVVRTAGEVLDDAVLGSIEFGIAELGIQLIVVVGHERCGAVGAAIHTIEQGTEAPGHIDYLVEAIRPAVEKTAGAPGDHLENAVKANARMVAAALRKDEIVAHAIADGKVKVVAARYDLDRGKVALL